METGGTSCSTAGSAYRKGMHPHLHAVIADLESAQRRLDGLAARVLADRWSIRADPNRWSVGECVAHLNITSKAFLPDFLRALADPTPKGAPPAHRYRMGLVGGLLYRVVGPPMRLFGMTLTMRVKTQASFVPSGDLPRETTIAEFGALQRELMEIVRQSDGLPIDRVRVTSPFDKRASYNMYAALAIVPRHQHRHLEQAEDVWGGT